MKVSAHHEADAKPYSGLYNENELILLTTYRALRSVKAAYKILIRPLLFG